MFSRQSSSFRPGPFQLIQSGSQPAVDEVPPATSAALTAPDAEGGRDRSWLSKPTTFPREGPWGWVRSAGFGPGMPTAVIAHMPHHNGPPDAPSRSPRDRKGTAGSTRWARRRGGVGACRFVGSNPVRDPEGDGPALEGIPEHGAGRPLHIAFFTDSFAPTHDGVARATATLARELEGRGHEVTVFTVRAPGQPRRERLAPHLRVRRLASLAAPGYPQYRAALCPWGIPLRRAGKFDVVHIHTPGFVGLAGWLAARRWGTPTVGTFHTNLVDMLKESGRRPWSRAFFRAWGRFSVELCRKCTLATAPTEAARSLLASPGAGANAGAPTRVVTNGTDTRTFRPGLLEPDWRRRLGTGGIPLVTFLGRFTRDKGVHRFLDALARLPAGPPWAAVLAGDGPERPAVERRIQQDPALASRAHCVGPVAEEEKPALLAQSTVFVLPSLSDTSSIALLEAMACGAACVVTDRGGPAEIGRRSSATVTVDATDPERIASAIRRLLEDPNAARELGARGRDWVERNASAVRMASEYLECYAPLLARQGR